ncbi:hypothetical protein KVR01_013476 [Diaporthe batatas]|uniref:uncharacterized protein n=1 Tax=Diaporthe batatas TaxID=748121 RepID=UPI001D05A5D4|nr:uncharacterized protein KVR01_013476 [Diaporthe batatas]KAG8156685.1 hypothetical protein KVR01_013476 [Diaporthe batatas]
MATSNGHDPCFPNPIYQHVKDWAAKQEAIEKETKAPAPLNDVERAFLEGLLKPSPSLSPAPDDGKDYVSLLFQYRQAKPAGHKTNFVDGAHPIPNAQGSAQWTCAVELSETSVYEPRIKSFPAAGFGLDATGSCPPFAKKKDAKQYAAKCAMEWLAKHGLLPPHLRLPVAPQETLAVLQSQPPKRPNEGSNGVLSPAPKRKPTGTNFTVDVNDDSPSAAQRVSMLCQSMGLQAPSYKLTPAHEGINFIYNGYVDFGQDEDAFDLPEDVGQIAGVMGKDTARQDMAEQLLPHLLKMYRERCGEYASHMASLPS